MANATVMLFCKYPQPGRVKTRLAASIGEEQAAMLYRAFVADTILAVKESGLNLEIHFASEWSASLYEGWLGNEMEYVPQQGSDLGERMKNAFKEAFTKGHTAAIVIGSDLPTLSSQFLAEAAQSIEKHGSCIAPSGDGGYSLLGFTSDSFLSEVFDGIQWSSPSVYPKTMQHFEQANLRPMILPELADVDTMEDLRNIQLARTAISTSQVLGKFNLNKEKHND